MKKSILSKYHVNDKVPLIIKPIFYLYGYGVPVVLFIYQLVVHFTSKIVFIGREQLEEKSNYIFCFWHTSISLYFIVFLRNRHHVWMQHPTWLLKPIHVLLRFTGVKKIILGSSDYSGREAADQLVDYLKKGYSTVLLPDGPSGPPIEMKKGVLHISMQSNVPIVPMSFNTSHSFESSSWDRRKWPLPFSTITVEYGEPIQITKDNFEKAYDIISRSLG